MEVWIPIQIDENSAEPLYHQIETQLRAHIIGGLLEEGTLLPSIREFAGNTNCSVITIRRVYQDLENEGLLRTRQGTGTYVAKVSEDERSDYRQAVVEKAVDAAIDAGISVQYTSEQLKSAFLNRLSLKYDGLNEGRESR